MLQSKLKMSVRKFFLLSAGLAFALGASAHAAATLEFDKPSLPDKTLLTQATEKPDGLTKLSPGLDDAPIARLTAALLQQFNYRQQRFDNTVSSNFLARFINDLDSQHIHFLQSDVAEFAHYTDKLDDLTLRYGDTTPAYEIFTRFRERLMERTTFCESLLKTEAFKFDTDDKFIVNRHKEPYPADLTEAHQLWRDRLRFEYLQELLNAESPTKTNSLAKNSTTNAPAKSKDAKAADAKPKTPQQIRDDIVKTLTKRYDRIFKMFRDWDEDDVLQYYLTTLAHVYDPHSDYFGKAQLEEFSMGMNLSLFGIGALLTSEDGVCKIKELKPGPAAKSGKIKEGDSIVAVAQGTNEPVDVVEMPLNKVVHLIRGAKNSEVRLTIMPADATDPSTRKVVSLLRDEIKLEDQQAKAKLIVLPANTGHDVRLGVIQLPSFYATMDMSSALEHSTPRSTTADVTKLLIKLAEAKVDGVILDLRRNGGGSLEEAIRLTGLFIKQGPVVQVRDPSGATAVKSDDDPSELYDGPLMVMTDRFTASASEIVAGALQDYGRALIVGDVSTHGKGTVQTLSQYINDSRLRGALLTTNDPGALKLTIQKFYRPSGRSTQLKGVTPDIILPSIENVRDDIGEISADNPLQWDVIPSSDYEHMNRVAPFLQQLTKNSAQRIASEKDYSYLREDIDQFTKAQADKTVSLNEAKRLKEARDNEARFKARDAERSARKTVEPVVYEISLKQAELPGLPAPVAKTNAVAAVTGKADATADAADDEKKPALDIGLDEAERILADYVALLAKNAVAAK
jgi:carboxyl-terminal processing protease